MQHFSDNGILVHIIVMKELVEKELENYKITETKVYT